MDQIQNNVINKIKQLIKELNKKNIKIEKAYLFGSFAKGNYNELSDIDIALVSNSFLGNRVLDNDLIREMTVSVDPNIYTTPYNPIDFDENDYFVKEIISTGIRVQ